MSALSIDIFCRQCGYNLRGLCPEGACPECATPVEHSLRGELIRDGAPSWVRILARGAAVMTAGWTIAALPRVLRSTAFYPAPEIEFSIHLASSALCLLGFWLLSTPDPSGLGQAAYGRVRKLARLALPSVTLLGMLYRSIHQWLAPEPALMTAVFVVMGFLSIVAYAAQLHYLQLLCGRLPSPRFSKWARVLKFVLAVADGARYAVAVLFILQLTNYRPVVLALIWGPNAVFLAASIAYWFWLLRLTQRLRREAVLAALQWQSRENTRLAPNS